MVQKHYTGATIRRAENKDSYFRMHRGTAQDASLSFEARGVIAYILSKPDGWDIQVKDLQQGCKKGRVYRILDELKAAGYLEDRVKYRDDKNRWQWTPYILHEIPIKNIIDLPTESPYPQNQDMGQEKLPYPQKRDTEKRDTENQEIIHITEEKEQKKENTLPQAVEAPAEVVETVQEKPDIALLAQAIEKRLNLHKGRQWFVAHMLQGTSKKGEYKQYAEYFKDKPVSVEVFNKFVDYFEANCKGCTLAAPGTIADWFGKYEAHLAKQATEQKRKHDNRKLPINLEMLATRESA